MQVNEITSAAALNVKPETVTNSVALANMENSTHVQPKVAQSPVSTDSVVLSNIPVSAAKQSPNKEINNQKKTQLATSHVIEEYNAKGELRVKFVDNKNNVIYQIPSEMVTKMQDLMLKSETATNAKV